MYDEKRMDKIIFRIKSRRSELGMSYQDLADKTGMSKSTLQRYETGAIKNMPIDKLGIIAKAMDVSPAYLMGWDVIEEGIPSMGHSARLSKNQETLFLHYNKLNDLGKNEATKRVEELTYVDKYIKDDETCATVDEDDYLMPIAAHNDDLTDSEKEEMNRRIAEIIEKRKMK